MMRRIINHLYFLYLRKKWSLGKNAAGMVCGAFTNDYRMHKAGFWETRKIHSYGFSVEDWKTSHITKETKDKYLSTVQYYKLHPLNGKYTKWIDDKLTLKYLCAGTQLDRYLPKYYFLIDGKGRLVRLCDTPDDEKTPVFEDVATMLREKGSLAIKLRVGAIGKGFYKAVYDNGSYSMNDKKYELKEFVEAIKKLRDCLVIEYLKPHRELAKFCPNVTNTIRYLSASWNGHNERFLTFVRFGTKKSGYVENYNKGGVLCFIDEDGSFHEGHVQNAKTGDDFIMTEHPDTHEKLNSTIPHWSDIQEAIKAFHRFFPMLEYMGFDFVVTDKEQIKILEINSFNSLDSLQLQGPIFERKLGEYFKQKLQMVQKRK